MIKKCLILNRNQELVGIMDYFIPTYSCSLTVEFLDEVLNSKFIILNSYLLEEVILINVEGYPGFFKELSIGDVMKVNYICRPLKFVEGSRDKMV